MKIKLVIAGDSHFDNYDLFKRKLDEYLSPVLWDNNTISVLCLQHYKHMLETYVESNSYQQSMFIDYLEAPMIEYISDTIIKASDCSIIFWDGVELGVKKLIEKCEWFENKYRVINYVRKNIEA